MENIKILSRDITTGVMDRLDGAIQDTYDVSELRAAGQINTALVSMMIYGLQAVSKELGVDFYGALRDVDELSATHAAEAEHSRLVQ